MQEQELNLTVKSENGVVTILHGKAPETFEKAPQVISPIGAITAPAAFIAVRKPDNQLGIVYFSRSERKIQYIENHRDFYSNKIEGRLQLNPDLAAFAINGEKWMSTGNMSNFIKLRRHLFESISQHAEIVSNLKNFEAKVNTTMSQSQDMRGNYSAAVNKTVDAGRIPLEFTLNMPLFVGFNDKVKFKVEIALEAGKSSIQVSLESPELGELIAVKRDEIMDAQLKPFADAGMPIIELE